MNSPVGADTAIRFFYYSGGDVVLEPFIFRPVERENSRLNTALEATEGRTMYVTFDEMSQLMQALAQTNLPWKESKKVKPLEPFKLPDEILESVDIEVISSTGTARSKVDPKIMCEKLKPLDSSLKTHRALWELQHFRVFHGCQIPGFNFLEYPVSVGKVASTHPGLPK